MKVQIAKIIFHSLLTIMKKILDLVSFKVGKDSEEYKYYKREIMDYFYNGLKELFVELSNKKIFEKCPCNANLRYGYKTCKECGGCGYKIM